MPESPASRRFRYSNAFYFSAVFSAILIRCLIVRNLPIYALTQSLHDDFLMLNTANSLLSKEWLGYRIWLGEYTKFTLCKGCFFPLFLAVGHILKIPYLTFFTITYSLSCLFFCEAVRPVVKFNRFRFFLFIVLLFNPATWCLDSAQRVYRCSVTMFQVLLITGGLFGIYLRLGSEKAAPLFFYGILSGVGLGSFVLTREDYVWILPFVITVTIVIIAVSLKSHICVRGKWKNVFSGLLPVLIMLLSVNCVKYLNYHYYGIFTDNELNGSHFSDAVKAIYSVKDDESIPYCTVSRSKMRRICDASPTLGAIRDIVDQGMDAWDAGGIGGLDGEVEDGCYFWCLRDIAAVAGNYSDSQTADTFFKTVADEINAAVADGRLETQSIMPSALMSPWRKEYASELPKAVADALEFTVSFESTEATAPVCVDSDLSPVSDWEKLTRDYALTSDSPRELVDKAEKSVSRLNLTGRAYSLLNRYVFLLSALCFVAGTIMSIVKKTFSGNCLSLWLIVISLFLSVAVLFIGVGYTHISAYYAIKPSYLSGAYPLILASEWLSFYLFFLCCRSGSSGKPVREAA